MENRPYRKVKRDIWKKDRYKKKTRQKEVKAYTKRKKE